MRFPYWEHFFLDVSHILWCLLLRACCLAISTQKDHVKDFFFSLRKNRRQHIFVTVNKLQLGQVLMHSLFTKAMESWFVIGTRKENSTCRIIDYHRVSVIVQCTQLHIADPPLSSCCYCNGQGGFWFHMQFCLLLYLHVYFFIYA